MKTVETSSATPPEVIADLEHAVQLAMTAKKDPEFEARMQAESEKITEEIWRKHGVLNIASTPIFPSHREPSPSPPKRASASMTASTSRWPSGKGASC
jgi:hypothetical protein